jgi:apolipoprotein N-acyltransferase
VQKTYRKHILSPLGESIPAEAGFAKYVEFPCPMLAARLLAAAAAAANFAAVSGIVPEPINVH